MILLHKFYNNIKMNKGIDNDKKIVQSSASTNFKSWTPYYYLLKIIISKG